MLLLWSLRRSAPLVLFGIVGCGLKKLYCFFMIERRRQVTLVGWSQRGGSRSAVCTFSTKVACAAACGDAAGKATG